MLQLLRHFRENVRVLPNVTFASDERDIEVQGGGGKESCVLFEEEGSAGVCGGGKVYVLHAACGIGDLNGYLQAGAFFFPDACEKIFCKGTSIRVSLACWEMESTNEGAPDDRPEYKQVVAISSDLL